MLNRRRHSYSPATMLRLLRHLLAIAILPFSVTVLVPVWLARRNGTALGPGATPPALLVQAAGGALLVIGLILFVGVVGLAIFALLVFLLCFMPFPITTN